MIRKVLFRKVFRVHGRIGPKYKSRRLLSFNINKELAWELWESLGTYDKQQGGESFLYQTYKFIVILIVLVR
jgi:hypothetical protein